MAMSQLPPPVLTSYKLDNEPVQKSVEEPVLVEKPTRMPVGETVGRVPVEERRIPEEQRMPEEPRMPVEEPRMPVEQQRMPVEQQRMPVAVPVQRIPVREPASVKEEQIAQRNQIMQHPSGSEGWLPAEDVVPQQMPEPRRHSPTPVRRTSISSARIKDKDNLDATIAAKAEATTAPRRVASIGRAGSKRGVSTTTEARPIPESAFLGGAGATGPKATAEEDTAMVARNQEAQASLTPKQKSKIAKTEAKHDKRLSKIIKEEGKAEKNALAIAIDELDSLQKIQKGTIKNEAQVQANLARLNVALKRAEAEFLNAKNKCDTAQAAVNAEVETLEAIRASAREATEHLQQKSAEVNTLRSTLAVDEREREVKLTQLKGVGASSPSFWS